MKILFKLVAVILVVVIALFFAKNIIAKTIISGGVRALTGLQLEIRSLNLGLPKTLVGITGLELFNPPGYADRRMVDMPRIFVDYNLGDFFKGKVHLEKVELDLKEFVVVKNERGELNIDSLKSVKAGKGGKAVPKEAGGMMPMQIDVLELKIGRVIYKDYSGGTPPVVQEFNININERYENITNPYKLASLIVFRALVNTSISRLANFDLGPLQDQLGKTLQNAGKMAEEIGGRTLKDISTTTQGAAKEAVGKAGEAIKKIFPVFE